MNSLFSKFHQHLTPNYHHPSSKQILASFFFKFTNNNKDNKRSINTSRKYVNRELLKRKREQVSRVGNYFAITQKRSTIGLPQNPRKVMEALGLRKIGHTVYHSQTPYIVGMIIKVKELLSVKMINRIPSLEERSKRAENGYVVIKRYQDADGY